MRRDEALMTGRLARIGREARDAALKGRRVIIVITMISAPRDLPPRQELTRNVIIARPSIVDGSPIGRLISLLCL